MTEPQPGSPQAAPATCWWHPDRPTGLRCVRCERSACPDCLREAAVGYQCIDCVAAARREEKARAALTRSRGFGPRTVAGARVTDRVVITPLLIALNGLVYVATAAEASDVMNNQSSGLFLEGALWPPLIAAGEWWRMITSAFLHIGPFHLLMNMVALWFLGRDLEQLLGKARFVALYVVSLLGGSVAVYLFEDIRQWTAGASGAIYGLLGAILVAAIRLRLDLTFIVVIIGINLVISFRVQGISWLGHLGGFAVGALVTIALVYAPARVRTPVQVGTVVAVTVALVALFLVRDAQLAAQLAPLL
ncbi:rhomboid family intramembrane serine protease [Thermocrispum sp.]|nr:rhomboid family intramembrane serine protease [Thermocrispum sp.]